MTLVMASSLISNTHFDHRTTNNNSYISRSPRKASQREINFTRTNDEGVVSRGSFWIDVLRNPARYFLAKWNELVFIFKLTELRVLPGFTKSSLFSGSLLVNSSAPAVIVSNLHFKLKKKRKVMLLSQLSLAEQNIFYCWTFLFILNITNQHVILLLCREKLKDFSCQKRSFLNAIRT